MGVERRLAALTHAGEHRQHGDAVRLPLLAKLVGRLLGCLAFGRLGAERRGLGHGQDGLGGRFEPLGIPLGAASLVGIAARGAEAALAREVGRAQVQVGAPFGRAGLAVLLESLEVPNLGENRGGFSLVRGFSLGPLGLFGGPLGALLLFAAGAPLVGGPFGHEECRAIAAGLLLGLDITLDAPDQLEADHGSTGDAVGALALVLTRLTLARDGDVGHLDLLLRQERAKFGEVVGLVGHVHWGLL